MPRAGKKADPSLLNKITKSSTKEVATNDPLKRHENKTNNTPDLSMFKFEKKPHVKIEYEKDSSEKVEEEPKGLWEPANWKEFLINLRNMRSNNDAPVDSMGCHMAMDENAPPNVMRYQSLIALMLSSQTKDQVTFAAMERLREKGLTVDNVLTMSDEELGKLIYPVGFWKTKVKYIKKTTQTLKEQYASDIPDSVDKLCKLTGVGPKMAHICMQVAWNKTTGIGVDTHVHRISNRIGWVKKQTATPEDTRKALQSWLPFDLWSEVNHLMVGFGQTICQPISPLCHECLNRDICPSSGIGRKSPNKKPSIKQENEIKEEIQISDRVQSFLSVSPGKRKITPKKTDCKVTAEYEIKDNLKVEDIPPPSQKRKITPKKNIEKIHEPEDLLRTNQEILQSASLSLNKRKTPTKNAPKVLTQQEVKDTLKVEDIPSASRKRKITPKKNLETTNKLEDTNQLEILQSAPISPNKRKPATKTDPKRKTKQEDKDTLKVEDMSTASWKRKLTLKKNMEITNELEDVTKQEVLQSALKSPSKRKTPKKNDSRRKTTQEAEDTSPASRKGVMPKKNLKTT